MLEDNARDGTLVEAADAAGKTGPAPVRDSQRSLGTLERQMRT